MLDRDEFIRPGTTVETLAGLKPSFAMMGEHGGFDAVALQKYHWVEGINHVHTPGNSSGHRRRRTLLAIGNEQIANDLDLTPRARILATAVSGADPTIMLTGPAPATRKALKKAGLTIEDIDLIEMNEAFAAVVLRFVKDMDVDIEKVNVNGGAIAMGHPLAPRCVAGAPRASRRRWLPGERDPTPSSAGRSRVPARSRSRRLSSCACAASPTCACSTAVSSGFDARPELRPTRPMASASSRSRASTAATRSVSSSRSRPSSCSAAMRIARRRSCSVSIETGSFFCLPNKATRR